MMWPRVVPWHVKLKITSIVILLISQIVLRSKCALYTKMGRKAAVSLEPNICSLLTHVHIIMLL